MLLGKIQNVVHDCMSFLPGSKTFVVSHLNKLYVPNYTKGTNPITPQAKRRR
jgi:hypothetical protein